MLYLVDHTTTQQHFPSQPSEPYVLIFLELLVLPRCNNVFDGLVTFENCYYYSDGSRKNKYPSLCCFVSSVHGLRESELFAPKEDGSTDSIVLSDGNCNGRAESKTVLGWCLIAETADGEGKSQTVAAGTGFNKVKAVRTTGGENFKGGAVTRGLRAECIRMNGVESQVGRKEAQSLGIWVTVTPTATLLPQEMS